MPDLSSVNRSYTIYLQRRGGKTDTEIVESLPFIELTASEMWDRLLRKSRVVKRLFPKSAFLVALDSPTLQE